MHDGTFHVRGRLSILLTAPGCDSNACKACHQMAEHPEAPSQKIGMLSGADHSAVMLTGLMLWGDLHSVDSMSGKI